MNITATHGYFTSESIHRKCITLQQKIMTSLCNRSVYITDQFNSSHCRQTVRKLTALQKTPRDKTFTFARRGLLFSLAATHLNPYHSSIRSHPIWSWPDDPITAQRTRRAQKRNVRKQLNLQQEEELGRNDEGCTGDQAEVWPPPCVSSRCSLRLLQESVLLKHDSARISCINSRPTE